MGATNLFLFFLSAVVLGAIFGAGGLFFSGPACRFGNKHDESSNPTTNTTYQTDNRQVNDLSGNAGLIATGGASIVNTVTDAGAISGAFDFGKFALGTVDDFGHLVVDSLRQNNQGVQQALTGAAQMVQSAYADARGRSLTTDYLLLAAIAMAGAVAFVAVKKGR